MTVTLEIPDELAARLGGDIARRALEAFALEELKAGRMYKHQVRELLGLSRYDMDGFLKQHGMIEEYTIEDVRRDVEDIRKALAD